MVPEAPARGPTGFRTRLPEIPALVPVHGSINPSGSVPALPTVLQPQVDIVDYVSIDDAAAVPISIGRTRAKDGRPAIALVTAIPAIRKICTVAGRTAAALRVTALRRLQVSARNLKIQKCIFLERSIAFYRSSLAPCSRCVLFHHFSSS